MQNTEHNLLKERADAKSPVASNHRIWRRAAPFAFGILVLAVVVLTVLSSTEINDFLAIARTARPQWLFLAITVQAATYSCSASVWYLSLRRSQHRPSLLSMIPLSVAKLFTDQAVPTGGVSGAMLVIRGLLRRHVPAPDAMATMLVTLVSYYSAYLIAVLAALAILWFHHQANAPLVAATAVFAVVAVGVPALILGARSWGSELAGTWARRIPGPAAFLEATRGAPTNLLRSPRLMTEATALQFAIFLLDASTLWIAFEALGHPTAFWIVFVSNVTASVAATLGPIPLGLGTFEAGAVAMLALLGTPIEAALAGTLLLRGLTFWLPMLPGIWFARREIRIQSDQGPSQGSVPTR